MKLIMLARKPVTESTTQSVLSHGTGTLNINASRLEFKADSMGGSANTSVRSVGQGRFMKGMASVPHPNVGRYPANVILAHKPGCKQDGVIEMGSGTFRDNVYRTSTMLNPSTGWNKNALDNNKKNAPTNRGREITPKWVCVDDCCFQQDLIRYFKTIQEVCK